jgi:hypothetical protein
MCVAHSYINLSATRLNSLNFLLSSLLNIKPHNPCFQKELLLCRIVLLPPCAASKTPPLLFHVCACVKYYHSKSQTKSRNLLYKLQPHHSISLFPERKSQTTLLPFTQHNSISNPHSSKPTCFFHSPTAHPLHSIPIKTL